MDQADDKQYEIYSRMTPAERIQRAVELFYAARQLKFAHIRQSRPDLTDAEVEREVVRAFLYASD